MYYAFRIGIRSVATSEMFRKMQAMPSHALLIYVTQRGIMLSHHVMPCNSNALLCYNYLLVLNTMPAARCSNTFFFSSIQTRAIVNRLLLILYLEHFYTDL